MKLLEALPRESILTDLKATDKKGILNELVSPLAESAGIDHDELVRVLMERERLGSTGIGSGIGIPHGKLAGIEHLLLGFGHSRNGVDFESIDGKPAHIFFLLVTPENSTGLHLKVLSRISRILKNDLFRERLMEAASADEIIAVIAEYDEDF